VGAAPSPGEIRAELEAILSTPAFRRSDRQSRFLRYVCEAALEGNATALNEVLIAHEVFGRGPDYSPGEDAVVRRQAHALRQKLQEYYAKDGVNDPIRIELPVGRYVPVFVRPSSTGPSVPAEAPSEIVEEAAPAKIVPGAPVIALSAVLVAGAFAGGWFLANRTHGDASRSAGGATEELWGHWLSNPAGAVICFSNPLTTVVKHFDTPLPPDSLPKRISVSPEQDAQIRGMLHMPPGGYIYLSPANAQAKMGEALGAVALVNLFARFRTRAQATQSRFLNWEDFRSQNLVLLGHDEANQWLDPILQQLPFRLAATKGDLPRRIVNTAPGKGESPEYRIQFPPNGGDPREDYALISMLEGIDHQHELLLLNGLNTEGTQSAIEFLTNPATTQTLVAALREAAPSHTGPWRFQAVLHTEVRDKIPTSAEIVALRVLDQR
jgi:hypothetical protein